MIRITNGVCWMAFFAALVLTATGCSVFISTPRVARFHVQRLDNKLVEYIIKLDDATESNLEIKLSSRYTLQLEFDWLWNLANHPEYNIEAGAGVDGSELTPWMVCKYRF